MTLCNSIGIDKITDRKRIRKLLLTMKYAVKGSAK